MSILNFRVLTTAIAGIALTAQCATPAFAQYRGYVQQPSIGQKTRGFMYRHPKVKSATVGAAVGTAGGAAIGLISGRGIMRGALIGAGTGAGVGLVRSSSTLQRHPIMRSTATGTVAGLGIGMAAGRGHGSGLKGAAVGGAVGLGLGALSQVLR